MRGPEDDYRVVGTRCVQKQTASVNNMNMAIYSGMNLLLTVYLPLQEQTKHASQNALSIIYLATDKLSLRVFARTPPSILKGILRSLNFVYIKINIK